MALTVKGLDVAMNHAAERAKRAKNLRPALKVVAQVVTKANDDSFRLQQSPAGVMWPDLAQSTIENRARKAGARQRLKDPETGKRTGQRRGKLTRKALMKRLSILLDKGSVTPLVDTAIMRNSQRMVVKGMSSAQWSAIKYGVYHMTGAAGAGRSRTVTIPQRNWTVFEPVGEGLFQLIPKMQERVQRILVSYVIDGKLRSR